MKVRHFAILLLVISLFLIPMSFAASEDADDLGNVSDDDVQMELSLNESVPVESDYDNSYFNGNNTIEEPILDDSFANPRISFTDRNTFYVNASYYGSDEIGTVSHPFKDINSAFSSLTLNRSVVNIYVAEGTYEVSKTISITKNLNIIGQNPLNTVISGKNASQILLVNKNSLVINVVNLTFAFGNNYYGGAIYNNRSTVKLINAVFRQNYAVGYSSISANYSAAGGALYNEAGTYKIYNSTFMDNLAKSSLNVYGAAIYNDLGTLSILNSKFTNNNLDDASYGSGGAIYNFNGFLTIYNSTFTNNTINSDFSIGGAIYNYESHNVYVINSTFDSNRIYGNYTLGAAIASSAILLEVVNSTISNNHAGGMAPENSTIYSFNGFFNFINSTGYDNTIEKPISNLLMCLEDQFISSRAFSDSLIANLPSKYDLRNENNVTYAKNQGSSGACWAFSMIAALESYLLKSENAYFDFSENNLKNLMNWKGINGTDWPDGGNYQMALAYFLRWDGPIDEEDDYYSAYSTIPNYDLTPLRHVQGAMFIPLRMGYLDNNQIKYAIMTYGALYASIYGTSMIKNVYNSVAEIPNHAVAIVGWDDDYPASKFLGTKPPGNGAWIIKNSWGTSYGDKGFGYVSYYDKTFAGFSLDSLSAVAFVDVENTTNYKDIYQYDILGNTYESLGFNNHTVWLANQFNSISNNPLSAFGLYVYGNSDYLAEIYVNGDLKHMQEGSLGYAGYHTIKLNQLVNLSVGDTFTINVKLTTPDSLFPVAIESSRNGYSSKATAGPNQSFISPDGISWIDIGCNLDLVKLSGCMYNKTLEQANVCLKAYTANVGNLQLNITSDSSYFFRGDEIEFTFNLTNIGDYVANCSVTFELDDAVHVTDVNCRFGTFENNTWIMGEMNTNGSAVLTLTCKILEAKDFIVNVANLNSKCHEFNLTYAGFTSFKVNDVSLLSKSGQIVNITLIDSKSNPVSNAEIIVDTGRENVTLVSDADGVVKLAIDLNEGNYTYKLYFNGNDIFNSTNRSFNIEVIKRYSGLVSISENVFYYGEGPSLLLSDEYGVGISNRSLTLTDIATGSVYNYISDSNGVISIFALKSADYNFICSFAGDELYYSSDYMFNVSIVKKQTVLASKNLSASAVVVKTDGKTGPYLKVTLKDNESRLLSNKKIQIKIGTKTYSVSTNKFGVASLQVNIAKSGTYSAKIRFAGDDAYAESSTNVKITVKKKKVSLNVSKKAYKASIKVKRLTATLKNNKGKAIPAKKVIFKVNGKKYSAKTNKKGVATVKVNIIKKKTYKVSLCFNGDATYSKITRISYLMIR